MRLHKKIILPAAGVLVLAVIALLLHFCSKKPVEVNEFYRIPEEKERALEAYNNDSSFKVVYDSLVHVWNMKTGDETNQFDLSASDSIFVGTVKYLAVHPSGKYLVLVDEDGSISSWDTRKGSFIKSSHDYGPDDFDMIEFTADGKYLFMVGYREATVNILSWPRLEYVTYGYLGSYHNSFNWENRKGKLIFYYEEGGNRYRTVFPQKSKSGELEFSKEVKVKDKSLKSRTD